MHSFRPLFAALNRVMTRRWPDLSKRKSSQDKYDWEFLCTTTWFAVDPDQHVAAFHGGAIPTIAMPHIESWRKIEELLEALPPTRDDRVVLTKEGHAAHSRHVDRARGLRSSDEMIEKSWASVSAAAHFWTRRGFFNFWGANSGSYSPPDYCAAATPLEPITLAELPTEVREIVSSVVSPVRFNEISRFHIRSLFADAAKQPS
jgi:hypothetical protein